MATKTNRNAVTSHSHYLCPSTDLINFAQSALEMHCGYVCSVGSSPASKFFYFPGSDGFVGQSDCVMQIYATTLSNEIAFAIQPGDTHV